jgi:hypothetical protein
MIKLDISQAVFLYLLFSAMSVLVLWVFFGGAARAPSYGGDKFCVWQCGTCTYTYIDSISGDISRCPLCSSLNERKEGGDKYGSKPAK